MADYIDREAFIKSQCCNCDGMCESFEVDCVNCDRDCRCEFIKSLSAFPHADVQPKARTIPQSYFMPFCGRNLEE